MHTGEPTQKSVAIFKGLQTAVLALAFVGLLGLAGFYLAVFIYQHTPVLQDPPTTRAVILNTVLPIDEINRPKRPPATTRNSAPTDPANPDDLLPLLPFSPRKFVTTLPSLDE